MQNDGIDCETRHVGGADFKPGSTTIMRDERTTDRERVANGCVMPFITIHEALRNETRAEHQRLDAKLNLLRPDFKRQDYCDLLAKYHGLYASFESWMVEKAARQCAPAVFYCRDRLKRQWLAEDLHALGIETTEDRTWIHPDYLEQKFPSAAHIMGAIYVIEGSMLGGCVLSRHFNKSLGIQPDSGGRFFQGNGRLTKEKWLVTLQFLSACDEQNLSRSDVISGAKRMFACFEKLVVGDRPALIHSGQ